MLRLEGNENEKDADEAPQDLSPRKKNSASPENLPVVLANLPPFVAPTKSKKSTGCNRGKDLCLAGMSKIHEYATNSVGNLLISEKEGPC
jgi:hypothetical protein